MLWFQWISLISTFRSDDAWFVNEIHAAMMQLLNQKSKTRLWLRKFAPANFLLVQALQIKMCLLASTQACFQRFFEHQSTAFLFTTQLSCLYFPPLVLHKQPSSDFFCFTRCAAACMTDCNQHTRFVDILARTEFLLFLRFSEILPIGWKPLGSQWKHARVHDYYNYTLLSSTGAEKNFEVWLSANAIKICSGRNTGLTTLFPLCSIFYCTMTLNLRFL